ncbi:MAG TPA: glycosyltransferase family 2 protein [Acidimicrobiales bacterium]|nr:glycosyltransferase family 2 protein [Acidimicrobiales bacterium]
MDSPLQAPPVVVVVVTCDSGPWLEEALEALAGQDYPNLSVLVIDAGSAVDPTPRVAAVLPGAFVRRLAGNPGYAAATNEALGLVEGASHFLLCHDDVAPEPDVVRLMVEEAFRSNAGLVTPKLVDWDDPQRLLQVGMGIDKSGAPHALVDRGELDQEQHDAVRDVFVAPGGCTLVRADLFTSLGGFDHEMHLYGEDLDLSWRAQIAGARVVVAPAARVRHREAMSAGLRSPGGGPAPAALASLRRMARPFVLRHRLRAVLKDYSFWHLVRVLPQVALLAVAEMLFGLMAGHTATARDTAAAWTWNLRRLGELRVARRAVRASRQVPDGAVRLLQVRGSARFNGFLRGQLAGERIRRRTRGAMARARGLERDDEERQAVGLSLAVGGAVALVLLAGSRHLITRGIPAVHQLAPFPGAWSLLRSYASGWNQAGLGSEAPAPAAFGLLGVAGFLLGGATGLLRTLLVVGALPVGAVGAVALAAPLGSQRARLAALVVYVAIPLPYNAIAGGRLFGVLAYAIAPWVLRSLLRATGIPPFSGPDDDGRGVRRVVFPLGVLVAVSAALAPPLVLLVALTAAGLALGSVVAGELGRASRAAAAALGAIGVAAVLLFPWSVDFVLPGRQLSAVTGVGSGGSGALGLGALVRFETGPLGAPPVGWVFVVAAALPLLVGRDRRLQWAARMWMVAITCWGVAWAGARGWLHVGTPASEVLLAPAAAALALAVALGLLAFEVDVPGYSFGWRQLAPTATLVAVLLGAVPVAASALDGRWHVPSDDFAGSLSWMPEQRAAGAFRVLWLGDPQALPLTGWRLSDGLAYATSRDGAPDVRDLWSGAAPHATQRVADAVQAARADGTTSLGHLLAPAAIRYVVVPLRTAPARLTGNLPSAFRPPPPDLPAALDAQIDLKKLQGDAALLVYENAAWAPGRSKVAAETLAAGAGGLAALRDVQLAGSPPVLPSVRTPTRFSGPLAAGDTVLLSEGASSHWSLRVAGRSAPRTKAFGWANGFTAPASGGATLRYRTPLVRYGAIVVELAVWALVIRTLIAGRRRRPAPAS